MQLHTCGRMHGYRPSKKLFQCIGDYYQYLENPDLLTHGKPNKKASIDNPIIEKTLLMVPPSIKLPRTPTQWTSTRVACLKPLEQTPSMELI